MKFHTNYITFAILEILKITDFGTFIVIKQF